MHLFKNPRMIMCMTARSVIRSSLYLSHIHTNTLTIPTLLFFRALPCGVLWMVEMSGCSVQDAARLMEIPVVSVVSRERGVKSPLDLGRTF